MPETKLMQTSWRNTSAHLIDETHRMPLAPTLRRNELNDLVDKGKSLFLEKDQPENALKFFKMALDLLDS